LVSSTASITAEYVALFSAMHAQQSKQLMVKVSTMFFFILQRKCVCAIDAKKILKAIIKVGRARITFFRIAMIEITHFLASKTKSYQVVKHQMHPKMVI